MKRICLILVPVVLFTLNPGMFAQAQEVTPDPALELYFSANGLYNRKLFPLAVEQYQDFLSKYPKHEKSVQAELGLALSLFSLGKFEEAEPSLRNLSKMSKLLQLDQVRLMHAQALMKLNRLDDAAKAFALSAKSASDDAIRQNAQVGLVDTLYRQKDWDELVKESDTFLKSSSKSASADRIRYQGGMARYESKDYEGAVKVLSPFASDLKKSPFAQLAMFLLAQSNRSLNQLDVAADLYEQVAKKERGPYVQDAEFLAGYCRFQLKDYSTAAKALSSYTEDNKDHQSYNQGMVLLGRSYIEQKEFPKAVKVLKQTMDIPAVWSEASLWLARGLAETKKTEEAEKILAKVLEGKPDPELLPALLLDYANLLLADEKFEAAAAPYLRFIQECKEHPRLVDAMRQRAYCLHRADKFAESIQACDAFLAQFAKDEHAHEVAYMRCENLYANKQLDEAAKALSAFPGGYPDSPRMASARFRAGQIQFEQGKWAEVITSLEPLLKDLPDAPMFYPAAYLAGAACFKTETWDSSISYLERFVKDHPGEANADLALFTVGMAWQRKGDPANAIQALSRMPGLFPKSKMLAQSLVEVGRMQYDQKQYAAARSSLKQVISKLGESPEVPSALYYLGWVEQSENQGREAAKYFGTLADNHKDHDLAADARLQQGLILLKLDKFDEAEAALISFLGSWPKQENAPQALFQLGMAQARQEKWVPALSRFQQVADGSPWHAQALYESAWCAKALKRNPDAVRFYEQLLAKYPKDTTAEAALFELAELEYQNKEYAEASERLEALLKTVGDADLRDRARYRLGWCYYDQESFLKAAPPFEKLVEESPDSDLAISSSFQAGECRLKLKEYSVAYEHFSRTVALERKKKTLSEQSLLRLGETEALLLEWSDSEKSYTEFTQLFAKSDLLRRAWFGLGWARENNKDYDEAIDAYRKVVTKGIKDETAARCQFQIGECYLAQKNYDQAIKEFIGVEVNYAYPKYSSKALLEMGVCLEKKGDREASLARYREIVTKYPDTEAAKIAQQVLKQN